MSQTRAAAQLIQVLTTPDACYTSLLPFKEDFARTDNIAEFLDELSLRLGAILKGGDRNHEAAMRFFNKQFREGKLGRWTLDDLDGAEAAYIASAAAAQGAESPFAEVVDNHGRPIIIGELGAVGVQTEAAVAEARASTAAEEAGSPVEEDLDDFLAADVPVAPVAPKNLEERVALTVARFLEQAEQERADADAGRNKSGTQMRKAARKVDADIRQAKRKAKYEAKGMSPTSPKGRRKGGGQSSPRRR